VLTGLPAAHAHNGRWGIWISACRRLCNGSGRKVCCLLSRVLANVLVNEWGEAPSLGHTCAIVYLSAHRIHTPHIRRALADPLGKIPALDSFKFRYTLSLGHLKLNTLHTYNGAYCILHFFVAGWRQLTKQKYDSRHLPSTYLHMRHPSRRT